MLVNGAPLSVTFGTEARIGTGRIGGIISLSGTEATVALHDLTGFEGRCDAILFSDDVNFNPPNELEALTKFRRELLGLPDQPDDGGSFDLVGWAAESRVPAQRCRLRATD